MKRLVLLVLLIISALGAYLMPLGVFGKTEKTQIVLPPPTIETMLLQQAGPLKQTVIDKVLSIIHCAQMYQLEYQPILTVIDYSMPANEKRLWVFDLNEKKLLYHTYVAHGIKSGELSSTYFSNKYDSKTSSIGVYRTEKAYYGREGLSLKLEGLEAGINDHAYNRSIVMHGGWYLDEGFIKKYGRSGRSWGCPALPLHLVEPVIQTIKNKSLLVVYYPDEPWILNSKFLQCEKPSYLSRIDDLFDEKKIASTLPEIRDEVFFADKKTKEGDSAPIVVMSAESYRQIFKNVPPLTRMLRRQIDHMEYIAISNAEFKVLIEHVDDAVYRAISFVIPVIKMHHGYYATEMKLLSLGKITGIYPEAVSTVSKKDIAYRIQFDSNPAVRIRSTDHFIRWLGL